MSKPFDATLNSLIAIRPDDWAAYFAWLADIPPGPSESLDTDLATTLQADKIFRINGVQPAIVHLELEANPRLGIPRELMQYNTLIDNEHNLPVESVLILMRPKARASDQTGMYQRNGPTGNTIAQFHNRIEREWEHPIDHWLSGGIGLAPLALLTDEANTDLERALEQLRTCLLDSKAEAGVTNSVLSSSYVLCGLRYEHERVAEMYRRLSIMMEESTTYQVILEKGREQGRQAQRMTIIRLGTKQLGAPPAASVAALTTLPISSDWSESQSEYSTRPTGTTC